MIALIREAFSQTTHPGDALLLGSREGQDAFDAVEPFRRASSWKDIEPAVLDANYDALSFLSEGGFRYFVPAYLVADLNDELQSADIVFHLAGNFRDAVVRIPMGEHTLEKRIGRSVLLNPKRYGAMTFEDYARYRLSVFTREEARAIVAFLENRRAVPDGLDAEAIDAALASFWLNRANEAPSTAALADHLRQEDEFALNLDTGQDE